MLRIGITGGIGTGKTTVCRIFELLGVPVFNADIVAKSIMNTDKELAKKIKDGFGSQAYLSGGEVDRKYLAGKVFNDQEALNRLNALVHPAAIQAFVDWSLRQNGPYVIKEAAILFESGSYKDCDFTILVTADEETRIQRVMDRDDVDEESVRHRMSKQMSENDKMILADLVVSNDGRKALIPQVIELHQHFLKTSLANG